MNCPRCAKPNTDNAAYCMFCGTQLPQTAPDADVLAGTSKSPFAMADAVRKRNTAVISLAIVGLLVAGALVSRAAGLWGSPGSVKDVNSLQADGSVPGGGVLKAQGSTPGGVLMKPGNTGPSVTQLEGKAPEQMPADVYEWLKHLEKCEAKKVEIAGNQSAEVTVLMQKMQVLGAGMGMMDPYDQSGSEKGDEEPSKYAKGKILDFRPQWEEVHKFFRSVPPPPECVPIAEDFDKSLSEIPGMMGDLSDVLNSVQADPASALQQMKKLQNTSYSQIDRYFGRCDEKVSNICDKYHTHKWFNIKTDVMAGGVLGKQFSTGG